MPYMTGYMNIYRSGWFHRMGKPNTYDRHAGDVYATEKEAKQNIEPRSHYIDTVQVSWYEPSTLQLNDPWSEPTPLSHSRKQEAANAHAA
jgi:hypothetical protein